MKRLLSLLLVASLSVGLLGACTPSDSTDESTTAASTTTTSTTTDDDDDASENTTTEATITEATTEVTSEATTTEDTTAPAADTDDPSNGDSDPADIDGDIDGGTDLFEAFDQLQVTRNPDGSVEMHMPAEYVEDDAIAELESGEAGLQFSNYEINADGSLTIFMTAEQHAETLREIRVSVVEMFDEMKEAFPGFESIEVDDDMKSITIHADAATWDESATFSFLAFAITSYVYQIYAGIPEADMDLNIVVLDADTGDVIYDMMEASAP